MTDGQFVKLILCGVLFLILGTGYMINVDVTQAKHMPDPKSIPERTIVTYN